MIPFDGLCSAFTAGELQKCIAGAGALDASCCSVWLVPRGILFLLEHSCAALSFAAKNYPCALVVLFLNISSSHRAKNDLIAVVDLFNLCQVICGVCETEL